MSPTDLIAKRAIERQLDYQKKKAAEITPDDEYIADLKEHTRTVFEKLERVTQARTLRDNVLEVGSGAHGHIFFWGAKNGVGVDPLADEYRKLFPVWQDCAKSINAFGENLPFENSAFDLVLSDNVVDHAENPSRILSEIYRVLKPGGLVYFTVHFHHPLYSIASGICQFIRRMGIPFEVGAFADHTFHFTLAEAKSLVREQSFQILSESQDTTRALNIARGYTKRHFGDYLKTIFFKNADYEAILKKET